MDVPTDERRKKKKRKKEKKRKHTEHWLFTQVNKPETSCLCTRQKASWTYQPQVFTSVTFSTKSLGSDSRSVHLFCITIGSRYTATKKKSWVKIQQADLFLLGQDSLSNKQNNKTAKTPVRPRFIVLHILLYKDSLCSKINYVKIYQSQNLYTSRFDVEMASNLWRHFRRVSSRYPLTAALRVVELVTLLRFLFGVSHY